jgi:hypothetical protein
MKKALTARGKHCLQRVVRSTGAQDVITHVVGRSINVCNHHLLKGLIDEAAELTIQVGGRRAVNGLDNA